MLSRQAICKGSGRLPLPRRTEHFADADKMADHSVHVHDMVVGKRSHT